MIEWLSNLPSTFEIHIYSQRVEDMDPSKFVFHRIPRLRGPHLFNFLWWLMANRLWRMWDQLVRGIRHDIVYSPGANCLDADAISIHIIFAEYICKMSSKLKLLGNPIASWPRNLHRRIYYRVAMMMERAAYTNAQTTLVLYAKKPPQNLSAITGGQALSRFFIWGSITRYSIKTGAWLCAELHVMRSSWNQPFSRYC